MLTLCRWVMRSGRFEGLYSVRFRGQALQTIVDPEDEDNMMLRNVGG